MRRSGRTTRMLLDAARAAKGGQTVYIVSANYAHSEELAKRLRDLGGVFNKKTMMIQIGNGLIVFISAGSESYTKFDWSELRPLGTQVQRSEVFIDHYTIESRFARVLQELHRWDMIYEIVRPNFAAMRREASGERDDSPTDIVAITDSAGNTWVKQ